MTKSEKSQNAAVAALLAARFEFEPVGILRRLTRRLGIKGARFVKPGTPLRVTVGKVTTCFYKVVNGNTCYLVDVPTKRTRRIAFFANESGEGARLVFLPGRRLAPAAGFPVDDRKAA